MILFIFTEFIEMSVVFCNAIHDYSIVFTVLLDILSYVISGGFRYKLIKYYN